MTLANPLGALHRYVEQLDQLQAVMGQSDMVKCASRLQQFFSQILWPLVLDFELEQHQSQWRSAITEMHRHMRLLMVEMNFVQSARNHQTRQQRLGQIEQRLKQLQGFAQVLINLCE